MNTANPHCAVNKLESGATAKYLMRAKLHTQLSVGVKGAVHLNTQFFTVFTDDHGVQNPKKNKFFYSYYDKYHTQKKGKIVFELEIQYIVNTH